MIEETTTPEHAHWLGWLDGFNHRDGMPHPRTRAVAIYPKDVELRIEYISGYWFGKDARQVTA